MKYIQFQKNITFRKETNMSVYTYFILGIILGLAIAVVFFADRSEKFESKIEMEEKCFAHKNLII